MDFMTFAMSRIHYDQLSMTYALNVSLCLMLISGFIDARKTVEE